MWRRGAEELGPGPGRRPESESSGASSESMTSQEFDNAIPDDSSRHFSGENPWPDSFHASEEDKAVARRNDNDESEMDLDEMVEKQIHLASHAPLLKDGMGDALVGDDAGMVEE
jgi:hypothetical protein